MQDDATRYAAMHECMAELKAIHYRIRDAGSVGDHDGIVAGFEGAQTYVARFRALERNLLVSDSESPVDAPAVKSNAVQDLTTEAGVDAAILTFLKANPRRIISKIYEAVPAGREMVLSRLRALTSSGVIEVVQVPGRFKALTCFVLRDSSGLL